jgi:hypothetical protein
MRGHQKLNIDEISTKYLVNIKSLLKTLELTIVHYNTNTRIKQKRKASKLDRKAKKNKNNNEKDTTSH